MASNLQMWQEDIHNDWCPGCGDFGILSSVQMALADLPFENHEVAIYSGIGCSGKTPHYIKSYGVHTLHGRVLPFATGAKLSNPELEVVAMGGDGDGYGIGAGHFVNAGRRNLDMAYIVFNNGVYGLTKGQASPTLKLGEQTKSLPLPNINDGINPLGVALLAGYTWVGRGYSYDPKGLQDLIQDAIEHEGAALLDVLQPCPTYNDIHTKDFYGPRVYKLGEDREYDGVVEDPTDEQEVNRKKSDAMLMSMEWGDEIPTGKFFQMKMGTYEDRIAQRNPKYPAEAPATAEFHEDGEPTTDISKLLDEKEVRGL